MSDEITAQLGGHWTNDPDHNDKMWQTEAYHRLVSLAQVSDPIAGKLIAELSPANYELLLKGVGHFVWAMSENIEFKRALAGACEAAGLETPPEATGPLDKLVDRVRAAREDKSGSERFKKVWEGLKTPRRPAAPEKVK